MQNVTAVLIGSLRQDGQLYQRGSTAQCRLSSGEVAILDHDQRHLAIAPLPLIKVTDVLDGGAPLDAVRTSAYKPVLIPRRESEGATMVRVTRRQMNYILKGSAPYRVLRQLFPRGFVLTLSSEQEDASIITMGLDEDTPIGLPASINADRFYEELCSYWNEQCSVLSATLIGDKLAVLCGVRGADLRTFDARALFMCSFDKVLEEIVEWSAFPSDTIESATLLNSEESSQRFVAIGAIQGQDERAVAVFDGANEEGEFGLALLDILDPSQESPEFSLRFLGSDEHILNVEGVSAWTNTFANATDVLLCTSHGWTVKFWAVRLPHSG